MIILGLVINTREPGKNEDHFFRDDAAALIVDGSVVSAIDTYKLQKMKKNITPFAAARFVLRDYGIKLKDVDKIALFGTEDHPDNRFENHYQAQPPGSGINARDHLSGELQKEFHNNISSGQIFFVNPHFSYAMNLYFRSIHENRLFLTRHKTGAETSVMILTGENSGITPLDFFPAVDLEKLPTEKVLGQLKFQQKKSKHTGLCITGNIPRSPSLEHEVRSSEIFQDIFCYPIEHASGWALGAGLYLYRQETSTQKLPTLKYEYETARDDTERIITHIWQELLSKEKISIHDNFFTLGGNSLTAIVLENEIHKAFNKKIPLAEIYKSPTIKELAVYINQLTEDIYTPIEPIEEKDYYASSFVQKRLYFLYRSDETSTRYNMSSTMVLAGNSNEKWLQDTFAYLIDRHESLRTSFEMVDDVPVQKVHHQVEFEIEYYDAGGADHFVRPFDLSRAPLMRVGVEKIGKNKYSLLIDMHHIISDGWSTALLKQEFDRLSDAHKKGFSREMAPLKLQYKDYAAWQNQLLANEEKVGEAKEFWRNYLEGILPVMNLPYDFSPGLPPRKENAAFRFVIPEAQTHRLREMAGELRASLFMVLLAGFNILLSHISGQKDIIIAIPAAARQHEALKNIIGMFVNTLILRNNLTADESFTDFFQRLRDNTFNVLQYQDIPLELIFSQLKIKYPEIFVFFNMINIENPLLEEINDRECYHIEKVPKSKFDIVCYLKEYKNGIEIDCHYFDERFEPVTIETLIRLYGTILDQVSVDPGKKIEEYGFIGKTKKLKRRT